jgi:hypothetical protein
MFIQGVGLFVRNPIFETFFEKKNINFLRYDLDNFGDLMLFKKPAFNVDFVLAFPPCTYFSQARSIPSEEELKKGLMYFHLAISICSILKPKFFIIENPAKSRVWRYVGKPNQIINQGSYGHLGLKPTGLYGDFEKIKGYYDVNMNYKLTNNCSKNQRDYTPESFLNAIWECNKKRLI